MTKEFVTYKQALALKELGFDEPCLSYYDGEKLFKFPGTTMCNRNFSDLLTVTAPLYQQAFRWFREKHGLIYSIGHMGHSNTWAYEIINISMPGPNYGYAQTYEEAEQACLNKLIEIVKDGKYV